jgi:RNA polymerase sigma factor (TIGR02999 family)
MARTATTPLTLITVNGAANLQWGAMETIDPGKVTALLKAWVGGDPDAQSELIPLVYNELRRLARYYRRKGGGGDTIQTTALVHEAYLRLLKIDDVDWNDRAHFFAVAAQLMRRILIDFVRAGGAVKRGGPNQRVRDVSLDDIPAPGSDRATELLAVDDALSRLADLDPRRARVVELRVFGGLTHEEIAQVLRISQQSVMRDWRLAKAWMLRELNERSA